MSTETMIETDNGFIWKEEVGIGGTDQIGVKTGIGDPKDGD